MKKALWGATALTLAASTSFAGGIDRSGQGVNILFEEGNFVQFTWQHASPSVNGKNAIIGDSNDVAKAYNNMSFGYKHEINENWDLALIYDQPFGAHVLYDNGPYSVPASDPRLLEDGQAEIDSDALTALLQYNFGNGFSVHGGVRALKVGGVISSTRGVLNADSDYDFGGVVGVAYEKPEIALRVALTYSTAIDSGFTGDVRNINPTLTGSRAFEVEFPESVNLDFQTGVAQNTLVFGSVRWVGWGGFNLTTAEDGTWVNFDDDTINYTIGVGQRINDKLSLALQFGYEKSGSQPTSTLLAPTTGSKSIGLGATYQVNDQLSISGGVTYALPGDQYYVQGVPGVGNTNVEFEDSSAWGAGIRIGYRF
mmetsp:Transcript_7362/g.12374  ORF Transcript_7362/g.12374 Transcript_7362/m.12374 type:complete len:368 (-) Transcript_7362:357-1460(-)